MQRADCFGGWLPGYGHDEVERRGVRPDGKLRGSSFLPPLHPFAVGARIVRHVGGQRGEHPVREENPVHAGNLVQGAV